MYRYTLTLAPANNNTDYHTATVEAERHTEDTSFFKFFVGTDTVGEYNARRVVGWKRDELELPDPVDG